MRGPYTSNIGFRVYLMSGEDMYKVFDLKKGEFTCTVNDGDNDCDLNAASHFVAMEDDGGASRCGNVGAKHGMGYCDARCPHDSLLRVKHFVRVPTVRPVHTELDVGGVRSTHHEAQGQLVALSLSFVAPNSPCWPHR